MFFLAADSSLLGSSHIFCTYFQALSGLLNIRVKHGYFANPDH